MLKHVPAADLKALGVKFQVPAAAPAAPDISAEEAAAALVHASNAAASDTQAAQMNAAAAKKGAVHVHQKSFLEHSMFGKKDTLAEKIAHGLKFLEEKGIQAPEKDELSD